MMSDDPKLSLKRIVGKSFLGRPLKSIISKARDYQQSRKMQRFYSEFVAPGSLCFDVGANVGNRTHTFRKLGARVIAIEPQTACVQALRQRFGSDPAVVIVPMGLSSAAGKAPLALSDGSTTIASFSPEFRQGWRWSNNVQWTREEMIELTTLDLLIEKFGLPAFCKIDVEGFEQQVLSGLSKTIPALSFEFNIEFVDQAQSCVEKLKSLNYRRFNYSAGESMRLQVENWTDADSLLRSLRSASDPLFWGDVYALG
jgi:FkbM family methyltransferase